MAMFKAFKPEAMNKIAKSMGYTGDMGEFQNYIEQDPARQARMQQFTNAAVQMARGGVVKMQTGGLTPQANFGMQPMSAQQQQEARDFVAAGGVPQMPDFRDATQYTNAGNTRMAVPVAQAANTPAAQTQAPENIGDATVQRMYQPGLPQGGVTQAAFTPTEAGQYVDPRTGMVTGSVAVPTAMASTAQAAPQQEKAANVMEAAAAAPAVDAAMNATQAAQTDPNDPRAQVTAAQQTASSVGDLDAAQGNATLINSPVQRNIQAGELITGAADAQTAAQFTEQIQAATATPSAQATVQGQLAQLTANFDATNPPAWAAGALRNATAQMAARGLGASSLAGQAIVQATIESALPIA